MLIYTKEEWKEIEKKRDRLERLNFYNAEQLVFMETIEAASYLTGGYENTCSDEGYTMEECKLNYVDNVAELLEAIRVEARNSIEHNGRLTGTRFNIATNAAIEKLALSYIAYWWAEMLTQPITEITTKEELKNIKFDFSNSWVYS